MKSYKISDKVYKVQFDIQDKDVKAVISGNVCDMYVYEKPVERVLGKNGGRDKEASEKGKEKNREKVMRKARGAVISYANANMSPESLWVTLTFRDNVKDIEYANSELKKFIKRLALQMNGRGQGQSIPYLGVIQFQDQNGRGAIHYHILFFNLGRLKQFVHDGTKESMFAVNDRFAKVWGHGFCIVKATNAINNIGAYMARYMVAEMDDVRLLGKKSYYHSTDLKKPVVTYDNKKIQEIAERWVLVKSGDYETKANGRCYHHVLNKIHIPVQPVAGLKEG